MPLFYAYVFNYTPPKTPIQDFEVTGDPSPGEKAIYAGSEVDARQIFQETFGVEAGDLIRRDRW